VLGCRPSRRRYSLLWKPDAADSLAAVDPATVLGAIATVTFLARLVPQPVRLVRTGVPDGVSPLMALNVAVTELAWLTYGFVSGLVPVWLVTLPALPLAVWTAVLLRRQTRWRDLIGAGVWLAAIVVAWLAGALGAVLAVSVLVQYGPQVWTALRSDRLEGIAPATWKLAIVDAFMWGAYGLAVGDAALILYTVTLSSCAVVILVRIAHSHRAASALGVGATPGQGGA
jgi:uncharacterized protein with PQ loop repeat